MNSNSRNSHHEWLVRMKVEGPVNIGRKIEFNNVNFTQRKKWIEASARVMTVSGDAAEKLALRKVSDLLNILSFVSDCSIKLTGVEPLEGSESTYPITIRVLNAAEVERWRNIKDINDYELFRALGYYRKGLNELDPFDAFLAFWASVEIISSHNTGRGVANRIVSFARTNSIEINETEVDDFRGTRNRIAHGAKQYDIDQIDQVAEKIPKIRELARQFLNAKIGWL